MKPYMGYSGIGGAEEGAVLIFAHTAREAKRIAWESDTFIRDVCDGEYTDLRISWLKGKDFLFAQADQDKLQQDEPHVIECPVVCKDCETWGMELNEDGYCEDCAEETK